LRMVRLAKEEAMMKDCKEAEHAADQDSDTPRFADMVEQAQNKSKEDSDVSESRRSSEISSFFGSDSEVDRDQPLHIVMTIDAADIQAPTLPWRQRSPIVQSAYPVRSWQHGDRLADDSSSSSSSSNNPSNLSSSSSRSRSNSPVSPPPRPPVREWQAVLPLSSPHTHRLRPPEAA